MKTNQELRALSSEDLDKELLELRREQFNIRMKRANDLMEKTHHIRTTRRAIARVKTIMTEKEAKN